MSKNTKLKYAVWVDDTYQGLLKKVQNEHHEFCKNLNMSEDETAQAMIKNRWEILVALQSLIEKDLRELNF